MRAPPSRPRDDINSCTVTFGARLHPRVAAQSAMRRNGVSQASGQSSRKNILLDHLADSDRWKKLAHRRSCWSRQQGPTSSLSAPRFLSAAFLVQPIFQEAYFFVFCTPESSLSCATTVVSIPTRGVCVCFVTECGDGQHICESAAGGGHSQDGPLIYVSRPDLRVLGRHEGHTLSTVKVDRTSEISVCDVVLLGPSSSQPELGWANGSQRLEGRFLEGQFLCVRLSVATLRKIINLLRLSIPRNASPGRGEQRTCRESGSGLSRHHDTAQMDTVQKVLLIEVYVFLNKEQSDFLEKLRWQWDEEFFGYLMEDQSEFDDGCHLQDLANSSWHHRFGEKLGFRRTPRGSNSPKAPKHFPEGSSHPRGPALTVPPRRAMPVASVPPHQRGHPALSHCSSFSLT